MVRTLTFSVVGALALLLSACATLPGNPSQPTDAAPAQVGPAIAAALAPATPAQASPAPATAAQATPAPIGGRIYDTRQTVRLGEIPAGAKQVKIWVCVPDDNPQQRVLDLVVTEAPASWRMVTEPEYGNRFLYCEIANPAKPTVEIVVDYSVQRAEQNNPGKGPAVLTDVHRKVLAADLQLDTPLMSVSEEIRGLEKKSCGDETDVMKAAEKIAAFVADYADHYSKDATKPKCGRGAAEDCLAQKGGCCTDLHSLFIALARAHGIPARMQFGYRLQAKNDGLEVDPGYRCWVEYFAPGQGWVASDIVVADSVPVEQRTAWFTKLDDRRVWCSAGRNFDLVPKQNGPKVNTMIIGYAEIDGKPVSVLPSADGKPSALSRVVKFTERKQATAAAESREPGPSRDAVAGTAR